MTKKRQPCASDSGVLPEPWPSTEQGVRQEENKQKMERTAPKPDEDPQDTTNNPKTKTQTLTPKNEELSRSGGGLEVNWLRPRLEIRLRYVGFPEETDWRCERASTKGLVRPPSKSCSAPGEEEE